MNREHPRATQLFGSLACFLASGLLLSSQPAAQRGRTTSSSATLAAPLQAGGTLSSRIQHADLAGVPTVGFPEFSFVQAFNAGDPVQIGIDTRRLPKLEGRTIDVFVVAHRTPDEWFFDRSLLSASIGPLSFAISPGSLGDNLLEVDAGTLAGFDGTPQVGLGYDVVLDVNRNGLLDADDIIDGWDLIAGFYVMPNLNMDGPYGTSEALYNGGSFRRQKIYYPSEVDSLGKLPLIIISHGNGHSYLWYEHLGDFLSSWGYVVVSHENETGPGIQTASESTLRNTNLFLTNLDSIAGGALNGHVDESTIVWVGHSRGGEGIVWAYNQLVNAPPFPVVFGASDIKLLSSIAPTDFLGSGVSDPLDVPFHLWTGGADDDVSGCANTDIVQTFHLHDRAAGERMSISLHGVGHGDFHSNFSSSSVAAGPCLVGRTRTHRVMKGYILPLFEAVLNDSAHGREYLWRQYENFRGIPANSSACIVADLMYRPDPKSPRFVLDDFQSNPQSDLSSSGGLVTWNVGGLTEDRLDDRNNNFTGNSGERFNGVTLASATDDSKGIVFQYSSFPSSFIQFDLPAPRPILDDMRYLSFRACQITRNLLTISELGDQDFSVALTDAHGHTSEIKLSAYGGGIEEPYQRRTCGQGTGWTSEWETIRIPLRDFNASGRPLDLNSLRSVSFLFGSDHGSVEGRLALDEIEFTSK